MRKEIIILILVFALAISFYLFQVFKSEEEIAKEECIKLCKAALEKGLDLSNGPCLGNPIEKLPNWVCDVAHLPRKDVDNKPENQCSVYREGKANHFVEVDEKCNVIRVI